MSNSFHCKPQCFPDVLAKKITLLFDHTLLTREQLTHLTVSTHSQHITHTSVFPQQWSSGGTTTAALAWCAGCYRQFTGLNTQNTNSCPPLIPLSETDDVHCLQCFVYMGHGRLGWEQEHCNWLMLCCACLDVKRDVTSSTCNTNRLLVQARSGFSLHACLKVW